MKRSETVYHSAEQKTAEQAHVYVQTHEAPHRYLAYKDIPVFITQFIKGKKALDYGAGTGASASFLYDLGLEVTGADVSLGMLEKARASFPFIHFYDVNTLPFSCDFDLVFSSFVLFELPSKQDIIKYLIKACSFLKPDGVFIGITGSEHLYAPARSWMTFDTNFAENSKLQSGDTAKLVLKHPPMEFYDYYWKEIDYLDCFKEAGLKILQIHQPLGSDKDPYPWKDELFYSPFTIFIAKKDKARVV